MSISKEIEAKILRYHHVERWPIGTIGRQLGVHHSVVRRVLSQAGISEKKTLSKESIVTPYLPFIQKTLEDYPALAASRLYAMAQERGYPGGESHFRHIVSLYRKPRAAEAFLRLRTLPGEQAQVDWGHFGHMTIGQAKRPLMAFVMVLSYSRKIFLRFYLNARMGNFLHGHVAAFEAFGGVTRVCLYDNLKSAVLERHGNAIRFNPILLEFSAYYRFEPRPVAIARGNEKGRVERAIRYVRDNFFAAREYKTVEELNEQASDWCNGAAASRACPEDKSRSVGDVFESEQDKLMQLPAVSYPTDEQAQVNVGKTPYVRFDLNDYSVPAKWVRQTLEVRASVNEVKIIHGSDVIARHTRSYDKGQTIEDVSHIEALEKEKKQARHHRGQARLIQAVPEASRFLTCAAERNYSLSTMVRQLLRYLDRYGAVELEQAMKEALSNNSPHYNSVLLNLQKQREKNNKLPPVNLDLPEDKRVRGQVVRTHSLSTYDALRQNKEEKNND